MAGFNILKWLYMHSPINFFGIEENGNTIIKSINNTSTGYKFNYLISPDKLEHLRKVVKNFKRTYTVSQFLSYIFIIYFIIFPNYKFFSSVILSILAFVPLLLLAIFGLAWINAKLFEKYLKKHFGSFEKIHFPASSSTENQSYKEFKFELIKITLLLLFIIIVYMWIGSPSKTAMKLIQKHKYNDAIKITTLWAKIIPINPKWYSIRAYAHFKMKNFGNAIKDYDKAYELENDIYKSMNFDNKIYIKYFVKDYISALQDFDTEIENAKNNSAKYSFMWDKAQFLFWIERYKEALKIYNQLLEASDDDEIFYLRNRLYYERSQVLHKMGKEKESQLDIEKAKELSLDEEFQSSIPEPTIIINDGNNYN